MIPSDANANLFPISIKGIIFIDEKLVLLKNEREEWELPGGKLEYGENPEACLIREINEELNVECTISKIVDVWVYNILNRVDVLIVTYYCESHLAKLENLKISDEHKEMGFFTIDEIHDLNMPEGYKTSIKKLVNGV